jgi:hypothetical protein
MYRAKSGLSCSLEKRHSILVPLASARENAIEVEVNVVDSQPSALERHSPKP